MFSTFTSVLSKPHAQCSILPFSVVPWFRTVPWCFKCVLRMILRFLFLPLLLPVSLFFAFHMRFIPTIESLYFKIFSASFLIKFLSPGTATSLNIRVPFSLSRMVMSSLLLGTVLSVCYCWFLNTVTLRSRLYYYYPCYHQNAGYLQLCTWNKPCFYGI